MPSKQVIPPLSEIFEIPTCQLLTCDYIPTNHQLLMVDVNKKNVVERIAQGVNPLRAWRECKGLSIADISGAIGVQNDHYILAELGDESLSSEKIISLCHFMNITPLNLLKGDCAMSTEMCKATYIFMRQSNPKSVIHAKLFEQLRDEALMSASYDKLRDTRFFLKSNKHHNFLMEFIQSILKMDGQDRLTSVDTYYDIADEIGDRENRFIEELTDETDSLKLTLEQQWKSVDELGRRLYIDNGQSTWADVWRRLTTAKKNIGKSGSMIAFYQHSPLSIGEVEWPTKPDGIILNGKNFIGSWKSGHKLHVKLMADYFDTKDKIENLTAKTSCKEKSLEEMDKWIGGHKDILRRFMNRQFLISTPEFKHLRALTKDRFQPETRNPISLPRPPFGLNL